MNSTGVAIFTFQTSLEILEGPGLTMEYFTLPPVVKALPPALNNLSNSSFTTWILLLLTLAILLAYLKRPQSKTEEANSKTPTKKTIPGPPTLPIIGNLHQLASRPLQAHLTLDDLAGAYGEAFRLKLGSVRAVVLNDYDLIKAAFLRFTDRPSWYLVRQATQDCKGIVWQSGQPWKALRRFCHMGLKDFGVGNKTLEEQVVDEASSMVDALLLHQGAPLDPMPLLQQATSNVTCSICFGNRFDYSDERFCYLLDLIRKIFAEFSINEPVNFFPVMEWLPHTPKVRRSLAYMQAVDAFIDDQIQDHRVTFDPDQPRDFVDLYLKEEQHDFGDDSVFSDVNMRLIIRDLFIAGSETTATTLVWLILYMVTHPHVQATCHQQIDKALGRRGVPTMVSKKQLPYIEATIMEAQRLSSAVPVLLHQSSPTPQVIRDHVIPSDTALMANVYSVHRSRDYWDQPEVFTPERFLDERGDVIRNKRGFLPFGIGPRQCPAESLARMELFIFFTSLLQRFEFKMADDQPLPSTEGILGVTLAPEHFKVCCIPREVTDD